MVGSEATVRELLELRAREDGDFVCCRFEDDQITLGALDGTVNRLANGLLELGLRPRERIAVMLPNHPDHIVTVLALAKLGLTWVPVNVDLKGESLGYLVEHSDPMAVVVDARYRRQVQPVLERHPVEYVVWRGRDTVEEPGTSWDFAEVATLTGDYPPPFIPSADDVLSISYTSGTTGAPKGVCVTDRMLRACARSVATLTDVRPNDTMFLWEPLYHIGGAQMIVLLLLQRVSLALTERFSASLFWSQVRRYRATHLHYLGGVLQILLKQPPHPDDADNTVRIAWGAGCTLEIWRRFEHRFGVQIRECYGMTEASSIVTANTDGRVGSVGKPLPYFDVEIVDESGNVLGPNRTGEIAVRERESGLITGGYFRNSEATRKALRDGRLYTGDLGRYDEEGFFYFTGRKKDSVRRRGENVSAWEVERIVNDHPDVEESAVIGVPADIGEEDIKVLIRPAAGRDPKPLDIVRWCENRLPRFQIPRYIAFIDAFQKTPSQRIIKESLAHSTEDCFDLERSGYEPPPDSSLR